MSPKAIGVIEKILAFFPFWVALGIHVYLLFAIGTSESVHSGYFDRVVTAGASALTLLSTTSILTVWTVKGLGSILSDLIEILVIERGRKAPAWKTVNTLLVDMKIYKAPAFILIRIARFVYSPGEVDRIFMPAHFDFMSEYFDELNSKKVWHARFTVVRYYCSFFKTAIFLKLAKDLNAVTDLWKDIAGFGK